MKRIGFLVMLFLVPLLALSEKGTTSHPVQKRTYTFE